MIFPGMDPYMEAAQIWPGVHAAMVVYLRDHLQPLLRPRYLAVLEERVYVEGPDREIVPDVWLKRTRNDRTGAGIAVMDADTPLVVQVPENEVHEPYVALLDRRDGQQVVAVLEVVSPSNKAPGPGRTSYQRKQREVLESRAHLLEIDLLRAGQHVVSVPERVARSRAPYDYLICVNRARDARNVYELYPRGLRDRLPRFRVPLAEGDPDVALDLQAVLAQVYEAGSYRDRLNYGGPCQPPLSASDEVWAAERIRGG